MQVIAGPFSPRNGRHWPVGQAASFTDPASGDPSIVIRPSSGTFVAFDAVCPHAGCMVGYDPGQKVIICPCHGSQYDASGRVRLYDADVSRFTEPRGAYPKVDLAAIGGAK